MRRSIGSVRIRWVRYLLAPLAPAALCFIGCGAETNPDELTFPSLEAEWSAGGSTPAAEIGCVKVVVKERSLSVPGTPEKNVSGMRLLPTSAEYNHVGGAVYTNANGEAKLYVKVGKEVTFLYNHPANYKLETEQQPVITTCTKAQAEINACACFPTILFVTLCGNGTLQGAQVTPPGTEQCDDGNSIDYDACTNLCRLPACGDGILQPNAPVYEQCDDGNTVSGDGCDANCRPTGCGNGIKTGTEACDDGNSMNGDGCDNNCTVTACGNGILTSGEQCDDGNAINGDGCDNNCEPTGCGNGVITLGEQCDDHNLTSGDGCDANCRTTGCGSGIVTNGEACDDGNTVGGDGCTAQCKIASTYACSTNPSCASGICLTSNVCGCTIDNQCPSGLVCGTGNYANQCVTVGCGNNILNAGEGCDDGNVNSGDGCNSGCMIEYNYPCVMGGSAACASGYCDPANNKCTCDASSDCQAGYSCKTSVNPHQCVLFACGNGILEGTEGCDDGNATNGDGCDNNCTVTSCGNGIKTVGEQCDDANTTNGDGCDSNCTITSCGNMIVTGTEQCDDANATNGDGCDNNCTFTGCGNTIVTGTEQCDDGNSSNTDLCTNQCKNAACGDGFVQPGETCDDANTNNLDACNNSCGLSGGTIATYGFNGAANSADEGHAIAGFDNGDLLVGGNATVVAEGRNAWIGRFPKAGGPPIWSAHFNGPGNGHDYAYGVSPDTSPSSRVLVIGAESTASNGLDLFLRKYDPTTNQIVWNKNIGGTGDDIGYDVAVDAAGNIAAVGVMSGSPQSFWVARYSSNGTIQAGWPKTYAGTSGFVIGSRMSVRMDALGNITVGGFELSQSGGVDKIWVLKYAANGALQSAITFNAPQTHHPTAITVDSNGDVLVTGHTTLNDPNGDIWTQKFSSVGASLWSQVHNGSLNGPGAIDYWDGSYDVTTDSNRNVLVAGYTYENGQGINIWMRKFTPNGGILWTNRYNGPANANDYGMGIAAHTSASSLDNVLVTGYDAVSGQSSNLWVRSYGP